MYGYPFRKDLADSPHQDRQLSNFSKLYFMYGFPFMIKLIVTQENAISWKHLYVSLRMG